MSPATSECGNGRRTPYSPYPSRLHTGVLVSPNKRSDPAAVEHLLSMDSWRIWPVRVHQPCGRGGIGASAGRFHMWLKGGQRAGQSRSLFLKVGDHLQRNHSSINYSYSLRSLAD